MAFQCFSAIMHRIDLREGGNTVLCHRKARRRTMDDIMTCWYPLQTPFRMITWAAPKFSSQASHFVPVPPQKPHTKLPLGPTGSPIGLTTQLNDSEYAECIIKYLSVWTYVSTINVISRQLCINQVCMRASRRKRKKRLTGYTPYLLSDYRMFIHIDFIFKLLAHNYFSYLLRAAVKVGQLSVVNFFAYTNRTRIFKFQSI